MKVWPPRQIVDAWHGELSLAQIARRSGRGGRFIVRLWSAAQAEGKLPPGERPYLARRMPAPAAASLPAPEKRDMLDVATVKPAPGWPPALDDLMRFIAGIAEDQRLDCVEAALAALICSDPESRWRLFLSASSSAARVTAHLRRHRSGEKPLPLFSFVNGARGTEGDAGAFAEPATLHLHTTRQEAGE